MNWIWGNGYTGSDYGAAKGGLFDQLHGCYGLCEFDFYYGLGGDGTEWSVHGKLLFDVGNKECIARAIEKVGVPKARRILCASV